jgi:hypothetical protein
MAKDYSYSSSAFLNLNFTEHISAVALVHTIL